MSEWREEAGDTGRRDSYGDDFFYLSGGRGERRVNISTMLQRRPYFVDVFKVC